MWREETTNHIIYFATIVFGVYTRPAYEHQAIKSVIFSHDEVFTSPTASVCVGIAAIELDAVEKDWATAPIMVLRR
jgi:hypothetical protein